MIENKYLLEIFKASPLPSMLIEPNSPYFTIKLVNKTYLAITGKTEDELINKDIFEVFPEIYDQNDPNFSNLSQSLNTVISSKMPHQMATHRYDLHKNENLSIIYWDITNTPIMDENGELSLIFHTVTDVTENRYFNLLEKLEREILEMNALNKYSLKEVISAYMIGIESLHEGMICSMQELKGNKLVNLASPSLSEEYLALISELNIGNNVGSCGTAAFLKQNVIVNDVLSDARWKNFVDIIKPFGLKACWSHPVFDSNDNVMATFAIYYKYIKTPEKLEENTIFRASNILKIILENHKNSIAVKEKEERLNNLIFNIADWVWETNENDVFTYSSEKCFELFGILPENILGKKASDFMPLEVKDQTIEKLNELKSQKLPIVDFERWYVTQNGERICLLTNGLAIHDIEGNFKGYRGVDKNITERKKTEEKIRKSEKVLRNIIDNAPIGIWYMNSLGKMEFVNKVFCEAVGISEELFISVPHYSELYPPKLAASCMASDLEALNNEGPQISYDSITFTDGKVHELELIKFQLIEENTGKPGIIGLMRDISEETKAKLELKESEQRYRTLIELSPEPIAVNSFGKIVYVNPAAIKMFGANHASELIGKFTIDFVHPDFKEFTIQRMEVIEDGGPDIEMGESKLLKLDGTIIEVEAQGNSIVYDGKPAIQISMRDITNRKQAEKEILLSNERYELVTKATSDSIWDWNLATDEVIRLGEGFKTLFGYNTEDINADNQFWQNIVHPDDFPWVSESIFDALKNKEKFYWEAEFRIKKACGTYSYVIDKGYIIRDVNGNAIRMIGATQDVNSRKTAELALIENIKSLEDYKFALNESAIIAMTDSNGIILSSNDNFCKISEFNETELVGKTHQLVKSNYHPEEFFKDMWQTISSGKVWKGDIKNKNKKGGFYWVNATIIPFLDKNKKPFQYLFIEFDITERKNGEEALLLSNERYNLVAKATNDSIWDWNLVTDKIQRTGDGFKVLFGYDIDNINNDHLNWTKLVHPDDLLNVQDSLDLVFNNNNSYYWEQDYRFLKADNQYAFVNDKGFIIRDKNGKPIRMIGATQDITERVKHLKAIEEQNKKLREIAWTQSHVVRAPLSRLMGIVSLLKEMELSSEEFKDWVVHFENSSLELDKVIHEIANKSEEIDFD